MYFCLDASAGSQLFCPRWFMDHLRPCGALTLGALFGAALHEAFRRPFLPGPGVVPGGHPSVCFSGPVGFGLYEPYSASACYAAASVLCQGPGTWQLTAAVCILCTAVSFAVAWGLLPGCCSSVWWVDGSPPPVSAWVRRLRALPYLRAGHELAR